MNRDSLFLRLVRGAGAGIAGTLAIQKAMKLHTGQNLTPPEIAQLWALIPAIDQIYNNIPPPLNDGM